jgi:hypothetical protein
MAAAVFFLLRRFCLLRQGTLAADFFVYLQEGPAQLLKLAESGNLPFRLAPGSRAGKSFAHRLALHLMGQAEVGAMAGMVGLMTMTVGLAAAGGNAGDRTTTQVTELGDLAKQVGALALEGVQRLGHIRTSFILTYNIRWDKGHKKRASPQRHIYVAHPPVVRGLDLTPSRKVSY